MTLSSHSQSMLTKSEWLISLQARSSGYFSSLPRILQLYAGGTRKRYLLYSPQDRLLAFGCADSSIYIFFYDVKKHKKIPKKNRLAVQDLRWNPRENYLIVAFKDGSMSLVDDSGAQIMDFDRQGQGVNCVAWIDNMSGDLITSCPKIGALKVWNVSHKSPRSTLKVGSTGVKAFLPFPGNPYRYLIAFRSGAVGIYNLGLKKLEFCTQAGHTETIFDLQFKPDNPNLIATVSYDGTTKVWDLHTMTLLKTLSLEKIDPGIQAKQNQTGTSAPPKVVCYGMAWGPQQGDNRIAVTNNLGQLLLWDYEKQRIIAKFQHTHAKVAIRVDWNHKKKHLLALNVDKFCYVLSLDDSEETGLPTFQIKQRLTFPVALFGAAWNPFIHSQLAISGAEGMLRIFDLDVAKDSPILMLKGHVGRVANLAWSPHFPQLIASTSDDKTVRVWNVESNEVRILEGHTQNTRAISWNSEVPWLLVSGSWDSSIRVWDIRSQESIYVLYDHIADVYAIQSHPKRPFVYASCSRDTSIRLWSFQGFISPLKMKLVLRHQLESMNGGDEPLTAFHLLNAKSSITETVTPLLGIVGRQLVDRLHSPASLESIAGIRNLVEFMGVYDGQKELISILGAIKQKIPCQMGARIVHMNDSVSISKAKAEELSSASTMAYLGTEFARKEDRIYECARLLLQMGDYKQYCELLMEIGEYDRALAFAPAVSLDYWQQLALRSAKVKEKESTRDAAALYQIANHIDEGVRCLSSSQLYEHAKQIKTLDSSGLYKNAAITLLPSQEAKRATIPAEPLALTKLNVSATLHEIPVLKQLVGEQATHLFLEGKQILAAAAHLSINDVSGCLLKLYRANELYLAYLIASSTSHPAQIEIVYKLAERAERLLMQDFAAHIYSTFDMRRPLALLAARQRNNDEPGAIDLCTKYGIKPLDHYRVQAEKIDDPAQKVFNFILAGEIGPAAKVALATARDAFSSKNPAQLAKMLEAFQVLQESRINKIAEVSLKAEALLYAAGIGAFKAAFLGYERVITPLIGTVFSICEHQKMKPNFSLTLLESIENAVNTYNLKEKDGPKVPVSQMEIEFEPADREMYEVVLGAIKKHYAGKSDLLREGNNSYSTVGSTLPVNANLSGVRKSIFSNEVIRGLYFVLEDGSSHMSIEEALEWAEVNRYSPLNNGCRINPF